MTGGADDGLAALLDREAIRAVVARYFRAVDRGDAALAGSVFHPDAVEVRGRRVLTGPGIGEALVASNLETMVSTSHHVTTQTVELDRDRAASEAYCLGFHVQERDGVAFRVLTAGRYLDRLERREGEWRVAHRVVLLEMLRSYPLEDEDPFGRPRSRRDAADPSYDFLGAGGPDRRGTTWPTS